MLKPRGWVCRGGVEITSPAAPFLGQERNRRNVVFDETVKSFEIWSGRRDSNPRRPAWEIDHRLKIQNFASMVSTEGDRITPIFNTLLQGFRKRSKKNSSELPSTHEFPPAIRIAKSNSGSFGLMLSASNGPS